MVRRNFISICYFAITSQATAFFPCPILIFTLSLVQEEIKITGVTVFVNPYTEPDEEDEKEAAENEKKPDDEENVCFLKL